MKEKLNAVHPPQEDVNFIIKILSRQLVKCVRTYIMDMLYCVTITNCIFLMYLLYLVLMR